MESTPKSKEDIALEHEINNAFEAQNVSQNLNDKDDLESFADADETRSNTGSDFVADTHQNLHSDVNLSTGTLQPSVPLPQVIRQVDSPILMPITAPVPHHAEALNLQQIDKDGFQQVISKNAKKLHKASVGKNSYPIRSRAGSSKTLK